MNRQKFLGYYLLQIANFFAKTLFWGILVYFIHSLGAQHLSQR